MNLLSILSTEKLSYFIFRNVFQIENISRFYYMFSYYNRICYLFIVVCMFFLLQVPKLSCYIHKVDEKINFPFSSLSGIKIMTRNEKKNVEQAYRFIVGYVE